MITANSVYNVKNRSSSVVVYRVPELNVRREFRPGETKQITFNELEKLTYQAGGREMLENFLQICEEVTQAFNLRREPEYNMSEIDIDKLLTQESLDAFLDALDFAPIGVIDLIKHRAITLPLMDIPKRRALKEKTGFDVDNALRHIEEDKLESKAPTGTAQTRRVQPENPTGRRTTPNYKIISEGEAVATN